MTRFIKMFLHEFGLYALIGIATSIAYTLFKAIGQKLVYRGRAVFSR